MSTGARWDTREYQRIASVDHRGDHIGVLFEDGSCVSINSRKLLPSHLQSPDWSAMAFSPYEITVPTSNGAVEISWSTVRALTDKEYSAHLADAAEEQARQIGFRLRELRKSRQLTSKELAERAGISPQSLSRIENGHHDVVLRTLQRILAGMG